VGTVTSDGRLGGTSRAPEYALPAFPGICVGGLALRRMMEALGASLDCLYWQFGTEDALAIVDLPDSISASALTAVVTKTGAFKKVETHEQLTQDQLLATLDLAKDAAEVFEVPGQQQ
jgi:uncharacterized protein with GYD domain